MFTLIFVKLFLSFVSLWIITFVIGRKEIGQLTPLDFFTSILLSEIVGNTIYDEEVTYAHLIFALGVWAFLSYGLEKLSVRFKRIKRLSEGRALLIVDKGQVNQSLMNACKLDFNQLLTMLREKDIFSFEEVAYVLYETNGTISVIKKPEYEYVRMKDLKLQAKQDIPSIPVIERGEIQTETFHGKKIDEIKIRKLALKQGFTDIKGIAYAEYNEDKEELLIIEKQR
ncbi:uncharacterized membrane protein YcaP (DUF421 family) [Paenibacillus castaneae]|uniref:DUF421 domain-containing protein n=1 Tax=Paenibacillus castaneae TaxID=474957 RepID=UPI00141B5FA8|nr:YetF domain-containing protein [Paenibacillus castaneae]NIK79016.1 uncharacterized membrane protein YcaP (DUF421 family) [Paenibacillus castaneae]